MADNLTEKESRGELVPLELRIPKAKKVFFIGQKP